MNKIKIVLTLILLAFLLVIAGSAVSQQSLIYSDKDAIYKNALELFQKQKYANAYTLFQKALKENQDIHSEIKVNASYYSALCAIELQHKDAVVQMIQFIKTYPESPKVKIAPYHLARHYYRLKKYPKSIYWFEKIDLYDLNNEQLAEYYFKLGYSYFEEGNFKEASKKFYEIKDIDTRYTAPARYYFSHIEYQNKNYETALQGFLKLKNDATFGSVVPYYIVQIYFYQQKYDEVIAYAPALLDSANVKRSTEITRILAESYFKTNRFEEAIPWFEKYKKAQGRITRQDAYMIGFAYYKTNQCLNAIDYFKEAVGDADTLTQIAYYHLGECYLKTNQKAFARNSFGYSAKFNFDTELHEDALFNQAMLAYELSYHPYYEAIDAFKQYLRDYQSGYRNTIIQSYLISVFLTTKNYKEAISTIEEIKNKTKEMEYAYQKVCYYRGIELYNALSYTQAIVHFDKALSTPLDKNINALSLYWKAEALFQLKKYDESAEHFKKFLFEPGAINFTEFYTANYNLGYCYYKLKDYPTAISWFRKYTTLNPTNDNNRITDALLRIADCYYITKDYHNANDYYLLASEKGSNSSDYGLYQYAITLGLTAKNEEKIKVLEKLINTYPESNYRDDARFEIAQTYQKINQHENAINQFKQYINEFPNSNLVRKAWVLQGLSFYNIQKDDEALNIYKKVVNDFPNTEEAFEALNGIKNIYVENGRGDEYAAFVKGVSYINISSAALDSTTYQAAELQYMKGNCTESIKMFEKYLSNYPDGIFKLNANYYKADCHYRAKEFDKALENYAIVLVFPASQFTERALLNTSRIHYSNKNYAEAKESYTRLEEIAQQHENKNEARIGLMRCNEKLGDSQEAFNYAQKVLNIDKLPENIRNEAELIIAKFNIMANRISDAQMILEEITKRTKSAIGAEAKYLLAHIQYNLKNYKESEKIIFELAENYANHDYWVAKAFILLADNYVALNNTFQAKHTLQSIIDNYDGEELKNIAIQKLNTIIESEKPKEPEKSLEPIEIELNEIPSESNIDLN
ncbi:MAG: tetratricopeptide repeat protein [Bacteroidia bacterium]